MFCSHICHVYINFLHLLFVSYSLLLYPFFRLKTVKRFFVHLTLLLPSHTEKQISEQREIAERLEQWCPRWKVCIFASLIPIRHNTLAPVHLTVQWVPDPLRKVVDRRAVKERMQVPPSQTDGLKKMFLSDRKIMDYI